MCGVSLAATNGPRHAYACSAAPPTPPCTASSTSIEKNRCSPSLLQASSPARPWRTGATPRQTSNGAAAGASGSRSEEHTSELQSRRDLVCRLLLEKKKKNRNKKDINIHD